MIVPFLIWHRKLMDRRKIHGTLLCCENERVGRIQSLACDIRKIKCWDISHSAQRRNASNGRFFMKSYSRPSGLLPQKLLSDDSSWFDWCVKDIRRRFRTSMICPSAGIIAIILLLHIMWLGHLEIASLCAEVCATPRQPWMENTFKYPSVVMLCLHHCF